MSNYKPYPAYRPSGVEWIGDVPSNWEVARIKHTSSLRTDRCTEAPDGAQYIGLEDVESGTGQYRPAERSARQNEDSTVGVFKSGDVLYGKLRPYLKKAIVSSTSGVCSTEFLVLQPKTVLAHWLHQWLLTTGVTQQIEAGCEGTKMPRADWEHVGSIHVPSPDASEQAEIIAVLIRETKRIDSLITKKTRFVELLKEKRLALITHAVTKGLDPNVKMRESGMDWIGAVPEHWKVGRLGDFCSSISTGPFGTALSSSEYVEDGVPVINPSHMNDGICVPDRRVAVSSETAIRLQFWTLAEGDLIVARRGELGRAAIVSSNEVGWICGTGSMRLTPIFDKAVTAYLYSVLQSEYARAWLDRESVGSTMPNLNESLIGRLPVAIPSTVFEQVKLLTRLSELEKRIDQLVKKSQRSIDLLKERRSAFITAAVTGQIDLRESV